MILFFLNVQKGSACSDFKFQYSTSRLAIYGLSILTAASANSSLLAEYAGWLLIAI
jgi:hypothetical protein